MGNCLSCRIVRNFLSRFRTKAPVKTICSGPSGKLHDDELQILLGCLPQRDRIRMSAVCRRWSELNRRSIKHLDLSLIPADSVKSVLRQCPYVTAIFVFDASYDAATVKTLARLTNLRSVRLYGFRCNVSFVAEVSTWGGWFVYDHISRNKHMKELVIFDSCLYSRNQRGYFPANMRFLPASISHLQITGRPYEYLLSYRGLDSLKHLQYLIFGGPFTAERQGPNAANVSAVIKQLACLPLRELYLGASFFQSLTGNQLVTLALSLRQLSALFIPNIVFEASDLSALLTNHSTLAVLVIIGRAEYENAHVVDVHVQPSPQLRIFLGKLAAASIRFKSAMPVNLTLINKPMDQFLGRDECKPILGDLWICKMLKSAVDCGKTAWCYTDDITA